MGFSPLAKAVPNCPATLNFQPPHDQKQFEPPTHQAVPTLASSLGPDAARMRIIPNT